MRADLAPSWTDERIAILTRLWDDGLSCSEIATEMGGISRNAVIGKVHRLNLGGRPRRPPKPASVRKREYRQRLKGAAGGTASNLPFRLTRAELHEPAPAIVVPEAPPALRLTILQLGPGQCRYAITDDSPHLFCGRPTVDGSSWCQHCAGIVYEPQRKRRPFVFRRVT